MSDGAFCDFLLPQICGELVWYGGAFFLNGTVECWCAEVFSLEEHSRQHREIRIYLTNQKASFELVSRIMKFVDPWQE